MNKLIAQLNILLADHAGTRVNEKVASDRTTSAYSEALRTIFKRLVSMGYKLERPQNLSEKNPGFMQGMVSFRPESKDNAGQSLAPAYLRRLGR